MWNGFEFSSVRKSPGSRRRWYHSASRAWSDLGQSWGSGRLRVHEKGLRALSIMSRRYACRVLLGIDPLISQIKNKKRKRDAAFSSDLLQDGTNIARTSTITPLAMLIKALSPPAPYGTQTASFAFRTGWTRQMPHPCCVPVPRSGRS
jgi:hypothetical protein